LNEDTLIVVHAYSGDAHQVRKALPQYVHHEQPVLVLSPADAPVVMPGVEYQAAGLRAYTGQTSLERQREHLNILLERPERYFLLHDSDSVCLEPVLPEYLYASPATVFYNASPTKRFVESNGPRAKGWNEKVPWAFQPPLFFDREALERMLAVSDEAMWTLPGWAKLIDWYFPLMAQLAGLDSKPFPDGISRPIWAPYEIARVYAMVRTRGFVFLHSVKDPTVLDVMVAAHAEFNRDPAGDELCGSW
jgi:hypothetical protein